MPAYKPKLLGHGYNGQVIIDTTSKAPMIDAPKMSPFTLLEALTLPLLVLPSTFLSFPECPLDVASTAGSTVAVFAVFV